MDKSRHVYHWFYNTAVCCVVELLAHPHSILRIFAGEAAKFNPVCLNGLYAILCIIMMSIQSDNDDNIKG